MLPCGPIILKGPNVEASLIVKMRLPDPSTVALLTLTPACASGICTALVVPLENVTVSTPLGFTDIFVTLGVKPIKFVIALCTAVKPSKYTITAITKITSIIIIPTLSPILSKSIKLNLLYQ
jgi:hypothetical protein